MRIWDINPGYLNDRSLLGEHCELHALANIITFKKVGYSRHPETIRWADCLQGLKRRHHLLVAEMGLRGFNHKSPVVADDRPLIWPAGFIDAPAQQYSILHIKYQAKAEGRIPLPTNSQVLWASHKYSVMARSYSTYRSIGQQTAQGLAVDELAMMLVPLLRTPPPPSQLNNTLHHMWGYVSEFSSHTPDEFSQVKLLNEIQLLSKRHAVRYLLHSTALGELAGWTEMGQMTSEPAR